MHFLENSVLKITVADHGAELCSVWDKSTGAERIWTADPEVWNRHAPLLFPFVGKVNGGHYRIGNTEYEMKTQHGFARDLDFECIEETDSALVHCLKSSETTRKIYPFDFSLKVRHRLDPENERLLHIEWSIENTGDGLMYYSIGGHPGFLMPPGTEKEQCFIFFPGKETLNYFQADPNGFALPAQKYVLKTEDGFAAYQDNIPDTFIFSGSQVREVGIAGPDRRKYVTLYCKDFPLLAVWANPKGSFICLEPWFGRTDDAGFSGDLSRKPEMETLPSGKCREISYSIEFH